MYYCPKCKRAMEYYYTENKKETYGCANCKLVVDLDFDVYSNAEELNEE